MKQKVSVKYHTARLRFMVICLVFFFTEEAVYIADSGRILHFKFISRSHLLTMGSGS